MLLFGASISFAGIQILTLLLLARLLGTGQYAIFSLAVSFGLTIAALFAEWLRLLVARYSGLRGHRLRDTILRTTLVWVLGAAAAAALLAVIGAAAAAILGERATGAMVLVVGLVAGGGILGDNAQTFVRFNRSHRHYVAYTAARSVGSGALMLGVGTATGSGLFAAATMGAGTMLIAAFTIRRFWAPQPGLVSHRRLRRFVPVGATMAMGAITTNATLSLTRLSVAAVVPAVAAGALFLALDLVTRGLNVLGIAFNTWAAKAVYAASHRAEPGALARVAGKTSPLFAMVWATLGLAGACIAVAAPLVLIGRGAYGGYAPAAVANIAAVILLWMRIFNLDMLLNALRRYRVVAAGSLVPLAVTAAAWAAGLFQLWALPAGVALSLLIVTGAARERVVALALVEALGVAVVCVATLWLAVVAIKRPAPALLLQALPIVALAAIVLAALALRWRRNRGAAAPA